MTAKFRCPHCKAILNPSAKIIMRISRGKKSGLALFSPRVGDYTTILPDDFNVKEGETILFTCPVCSRDLTSPKDKRFGEVLRERPEGGAETVHFHRKFGEHATFVASTRGIKAFGEAAPKYVQVNFFGAGPDLF